MLMRLIDESGVGTISLKGYEYFVLCRGKEFAKLGL